MPFGTSRTHTYCTASSAPSLPRLTNGRRQARPLTAQSSPARQRDDKKETASTSQKWSESPRSTQSIRMAVVQAADIQRVLSALPIALPMRSSPPQKQWDDKKVATSKKWSKSNRMAGAQADVQQQQRFLDRRAALGPSAALRRKSLSVPDAHYSALRTKMHAEGSLCCES